SEAVARARPDAARLGEVLASVSGGGAGCYLFAWQGLAGSEGEAGSKSGGAEGSEGRAKARLFAPQLGVVEDAATGSAAGPLGAFLVARGVMPPGRLRILQGEEIGRPSTLLVDVESEGEALAVFVGGGVVAVGDG